jgi:WD domain, G-beta repeat.
MTTESLKGHTDNILCLDIQQDYILTGSKDQTVRYWDLKTCLACYKGHTEDVTSVQFSSKTWFVSSSIDLTLKI